MLYIQSLTLRKPFTTFNAFTAPKSLIKFKPSKTVWTLNLRGNPVKATSINLSHLLSNHVESINCVILIKGDAHY